MQTSNMALSLDHKRQATSAMRLGLQGWWPTDYCVLGCWSVALLWHGSDSLGLGLFQTDAGPGALGDQSPA